MNPKEGIRTLAKAHSIFPVTEWHKVLYLGMHAKTFTRWNGGFWLKEIIEKHGNSNIMVDVVECNPNNIFASINSDFGKQFKDHLTYYDGYWIDYLNKTKASGNRYDVCIWWHGPEHVDKEEFIITERLITECCDGLIIMACPEGHDPCHDIQDDGLFIDEHKWEVWPEDFHKLGYVTEEYERPTNPRKARAISAFLDCREGN